MAFFDKREIIDIIRHEIRIEDETGIASRVVRPSTKRSKYGGLPLFFRSSGSDDDEEEMDDYYTIPLYEDTNSTRDLIASHFRSRIVNNDSQSRRNIVQSTINPTTDLFVARPLPTTVDITESIISMNVGSNITEVQSPLNEFAIYEASDIGPSKRILILYTNDDKEEILRHQVSVVPTIRVFQLISFCHYKYFKITGKELPGKVADYELYMAEEDEPIDTEFPELDRSRLLSEVDFTCMALVRRDIQEETDYSSKTITIYFPRGPWYSIHVPNPDLPFSWLIEEVLKRREERGEDDPKIVQTREYSLEPVDQFDLTMDLTKPISSTIVNEFVMIRKNSSRAGFHPRPESRPMLDRFPSLISPTVPVTPGLSNPRESRIFEFPDEFSYSPPVTRTGEKAIVSCFRVERLHRLKPKWTANLLLYWDELEISPFATESERRKSFLPQQYQKAVKIPWYHLVDVKMSDKEKSTKEIAHLLTIIWLPILNELENKGEIMLQNITTDYLRINWKSVQLECKSKEDASEIYKSILSMIQMQQSAIQQAWKYSQDGQKRPSASAEAALLSAQPDTASNEDYPGKKKGRFKQFARLSRMLLSTDRRTSVVSSGSTPTTPVN